MKIKGWTSAKKLVIGDELVTHEDYQLIVERKIQSYPNDKVKVYNFEVEDFHTYFVSTSNVLVHNMCAKKTNSGMNNIRTLDNTKIKGYKVSMDIERGGSGLINIHLKVGNSKYFYNSSKFLSSAGKEIPHALRGNSIIEKSLIGSGVKINVKRFVSLIFLLSSGFCSCLNCQNGFVLR